MVLALGMDPGDSGFNCVISWEHNWPDTFDRRTDRSDAGSNWGGLTSRGRSSHQHGQRFHYLGHF